MLRVSEFSSLNFRSDWKGRANTDIDYRQRFLSTDEIKVQFACDVDTYLKLSVKLYGRTNKTERTLTPVILTSDLSYRTGQVVLPAVSAGEYELSLQILGSPVATSSFCIVDSFPDSVLIKYTNYRTEFETIFPDLFSFRIEGVFLPSDVNFEASTEDFRDQHYSPTMLSAFPYEKYTFTVGLGQGVPNWVARKLNHIFSLSEVHIDELMYVRSDGSAPQKTILHQDSPLFIWKIELEVKQEVVSPAPGPVETEIATWEEFINILDAASQPTSLYYATKLRVEKFIDGVIKAGYPKVYNILSEFTYPSGGDTEEEVEAITIDEWQKLDSVSRSVRIHSFKKYVSAKEDASIDDIQTNVEYYSAENPEMKQVVIRGFFPNPYNTAGITVGLAHNDILAFPPSGIDPKTMIGLATTGSGGFFTFTWEVAKEQYKEVEYPFILAFISPTIYQSGWKPTFEYAVADGIAIAPEEED